MSWRSTTKCFMRSTWGYHLSWMRLCTKWIILLLILKNLTKFHVLEVNMMSRMLLFFVESGPRCWKLFSEKKNDMKCKVDQLDMEVKRMAQLVNSLNFGNVKSYPSHPLKVYEKVWWLTVLLMLLNPMFGTLIVDARVIWRVTKRHSCHLHLLTAIWLSLGCIAYITEKDIINIPKLP